MPLSPLPHLPVAPGDLRLSRTRRTLTGRRCSGPAGSPRAGQSSSSDEGLSPGSVRQLPRGLRELPLLPPPPRGPHTLLMC